MANTVLLREMLHDDLEILFNQQLDPEANWMAAFTSENPADRAAFDEHWRRIMSNPSIMRRTIISNGQVAGYVSKYMNEGRPEVTYWIGREFWGRGIASSALSQFLSIMVERPVFARAAKDNFASYRVLEKCGFAIIGEGSGYANARRADTGEYIMQLVH